ncbi:quinone-oxidoreductase-like protein [Pyrus ussuriensis x Pyrus communis]|uniref:Quinone-oxidoreductase-like protein n=1 Tax=Pyrus ussuriensis x Pyrus communis TaxID=2448454 RepID=A0A5N5I8Y2_9ROSA|nr:quinone-oxidoreductase-like protein [Pyrus ussuriensis x Pyrus communis]
MVYRSYRVFNETSQLHFIIFVIVGQGVQKFKPGDKVVAFLIHADGGGLAEYATASENLTVARPPEVSAVEGAGSPVAGITAHQSLTQAAGVKLDGSSQQKNILITAASGGVGQYAVQLAKLGNRHPNLSANGKVIDITPGPSAFATFALKKLTFSKKQLVPLLMNAKAENLEYLVKLVKEGKLKTVIDSTHPLSKAEDAWARCVDGHANGKIIVEVK